MKTNYSMTKKILLVDDDTNLVEGIQRTLRKQFHIDIAVGGSEGLLKMADDGPYAVVVADMQMPEMSGLEFLKKAQTQAPETIRMMLTGNADLQTAVNAVNDGHVFRYLTKPCPPPTLVPTLEAGLEQYRLMFAERQLLENTLGGAVKVLTEILSATDPVTFSRSNMLKEYVHDFTRSSNPNGSWEFELAAMLSQIGRVTIPPAVLEKDREGFTLTGPEKDMLNQIPEFGARLLENIPRLENVAAIVRYQQKHFDGSGCPVDSLTGHDIPLGARILKVLSDLSELEAKSISRAVAMQTMRDRVGWYDLKVLAAVSRWCDVALGDAPAGRSNPQPLKVEELRAGHILAQDLRMSDGLLIVAANTKLTTILLAKLLNFRKLNTIDHILLVHID